MNIADLEDLVILHVPDASSVAIQHVLRHAVARFMRESQIFTDQVCVELQCGVPEYLIDLPECRQLVSVEKVVFGKDPHELGMMEVRPVTTPKGWDWHRDSMHPILVVHDVPSKDGETAQVMYSWSIRRDDCDLPPELYEQWAEAVKCAALADLFSMSKQEWGDPAMSRLYENYYQVELDHAKARRWLNYSRGPLRIHSRPFLPCKR